MRAKANTVTHLFVVFVILAALTACRAFDTNYTEKFGPFLDGSLGEWTVRLSGEAELPDSIVRGRRWEIVFHDKYGNEQLLTLDNLAFRQSDEVHFARFIQAKALEMAERPLREALSLEDTQIVVTAMILTCGDWSESGGMKDILSATNGLKLCELDEPAVLAGRQNYALIAFHHYERAAYDAAVASANAVYETICAYADAKVNAVVEFVLLPAPLSVSGQDSRVILDNVQIGWICGEPVNGETEEKRLSDRFPQMLRDRLADTQSKGERE